MKAPLLDLERLRQSAWVTRIRGVVASRLPSRWRRPWIGVGLDLDATRAKAVVVRHHNGQRTLLAAAVEGAPDPAAPGAMADAIRRLWERLGVPALKTPLITTAVSGSGVVVRFAAFPRMTLAQLRQAAQFEAEKQIPYQLSDVVLDVYPFETAAQETMDVLLVAAKTSLIDEHLEVLRQAGVVPHIVDLEAFALANAWEVSGAHAAAAPVTALLGVEPQRTIVNILTGTRLRLTREFPTGGAGETPDAAAAVVEHLVRQLRLSFDYFENQHGQGVDRIVFSGAANAWSGFPELLHEALGQPVERWDPVAQLPRGPHVDLGSLETVSADLTVAWGLSLRRPTR